MNLIELDRVSFRYRGSNAGVEEVSLAVPAGRLVAVVGANGSGKSTLLKLMARVLEPESGVLRLEGRRAEEWKRRAFARKVGYLSQSPEAAFSMRARDVVLAGRAPHLGRFEWESGRDFEAAARALEECEAAHLAERFIEEMSGGEKKRVFLARILAADPELIVLDEPLASVDLAHVEAFMRLLRSIVDRTGRSVVLASHDLNSSAAWCDRMMVMSGGRLAVDGTAGEVMREEVIRRYFGFDPTMVASRSGEVRWIIPGAP